MSEPLPDFSNTAHFPTFLTIPEQDRDAPPSSSSSPPSDARWHLLAQVKDNMTLNKPTLVLADRDGNPFALVFEGLARDALDLRALGFRKGCTAVIPGAARTRPAAEGKRGFVRVAAGDAAAVRAVPGPLARVLALGGRARGGGDRCEACGGDGAGAGAGAGAEGAPGGGLRSCTGCERVGYCSKECQVKGWGDGGHKNDCKIFKALNDIYR